jgi:hypothetical protein
MKKESVSEEEEYDSEQGGDDDYDEESGSNEGAGGELPEVNKANLLNYQTDSDEDGEGMDSDDLGVNLEK